MAKKDTTFKVKGEPYKDEVTGKWMVLEAKTGDKIDLDKHIGEFEGAIIDLTIKESKKVSSNKEDSGA